MDDESQQVEGGAHVKRGSKEVLAVLRRHWVALDKGLLFLIIGALAVFGGGKLGARSEIMVLIISLFGLLFFGQFVSWWFSVTILSNSGLEIISQKGLFRRGVVDIPYESIMNTNYATKGLVQAVLGFGTIVIQTQSGDIVLEKVSRPAKVHTLVTANYNKFRGFDE
ncbi:MAG: PH domain-containing protein [Candidatus Nomurabacteria bacterium]|nr:MAG: PH domain-containing protein [Candidatus Nomurabacteria bacterium]HRV76203.1 PH domain-containing protein [Candidatus Saccharimonadales bacterium]